MKKILFFIAVYLIGSSLYAQQRNATISFDSEGFDFGNIKESAGPVTHRFEFTNTGSQPLIIANVTTSCGCTSPAWTKEPVLPGAKGFVSATYDVKGRPGKFEKTISVNSNAERSYVVLKISGEVTQSPEDLYTVKIGAIKVRSVYIPLNNVYMGEVKNYSLDVLNSSAAPVELSFTEVPAHLKLTANPSSIDPGQIGHIDLAFDSKKKDEWGIVSDRFRLLVNNKQEDNNLINVTTNVVENFSKMTEEQLKMAPVAAFENTNFDFGKIKAGDNVQHEFVLRNNGKSDLVLRNVTASCGCTVVSSKDKIIKPGATSMIKAEFDSSGKTGYQNKTITVITNDPKNSRVILWIKGEIASK